MVHQNEFWFFALQSVHQDAFLTLSNVAIWRFSFFTFLKGRAVKKRKKKSATCLKLVKIRTKKHFWEQYSKRNAMQNGRAFNLFYFYDLQNKHHPSRVVKGVPREVHRPKSERPQASRVLAAGIHRGTPFTTLHPRLFHKMSFFGHPRLVQRYFFHCHKTQPVPREYLIQC